MSFEGAVPAFPGVGSMKDELTHSVEDGELQIVDGTGCTLKAKAVVVAVAVGCKGIGEKVGALRSDVYGDGCRVYTAFVVGDGDVIGGCSGRRGHGVGYGWVG